ncbi:phospholipase A and acyltransferase 3-like isoform X2 [Hemicordylus capensis]|uniref:phospholipase A and acyltransferase 3-like isoform X2 n=1 Tax=Hemicordylus capensis TaxID=884348 RepID=UPI002302CFE5|nr:phospholipase A and acyltransferase 3-like isoform X2 [Hemicordylus capensis]
MGEAQSLLQEEPEPGDLLEIFRGAYKHWALCVYNGYVVHLTVPDGAPGSSFPTAGTKKGLVKKEPLSKAVGENKYRTHKKYDQERDRRAIEKIVRNAEARVGELVDYDLFGNNCEHFVTGLCDGVPKSQQVNGGLTIGASVLGGIALAGAALAIFQVVKGNSKEGEGEEERQ